LLRLPSKKKGKIMNKTEPIKHLLLDETAADRSVYDVTVPLRIAEEIGADDIATLQQFLDAIERRGELARFDVELHKIAPMTHLFLGAGTDGSLYHVIVPVRIAEQIGVDDIATWDQFLDAIDTRTEWATFEVELARSRTPHD
jgi:hypothetical protein